MLLELFTIAQVSMGACIYDTSTPLRNEEIALQTPATIRLHGGISGASVEGFVINNAPGLLTRCDVQDFLRAKSQKLRRGLLHNLYEHGCIDWKFLGRLNTIAKQTGYI